MAANEAGLLHGSRGSGRKARVPGGPRGLDWLANQGANPQRASRVYSRFVQVAKVGAALTAVAALGILVTWPQFGDEPVATTALPGGSPTLVGAVHTGTDAQGRPFSITAQRTWYAADTTTAYDMLEPVAEITLSNGTWMSVQADRGRYNQETGKLLLFGDVRINQDKGYEVATEEMHVRLDSKIAWGDRPITAQGPFGEISAEGFRLLDDGQTVIFTGPTRAILAGAPGLPQTDEGRSAPQGASP